MKKENLRFGFLLGMLFLIACSYNNDKKESEKFSKENPYAIEIAKERSFYQAEKLTDRLIALGLNAYMVQHADSSEDDGLKRRKQNHQETEIQKMFL
jgi:hypothetical protein